MRRKARLVHRALRSNRPACFVGVCQYSRVPQARNAFIATARVSPTKPIYGRQKHCAPYGAGVHFSALGYKRVAATRLGPFATT